MPANLYWYVDNMDNGVLVSGCHAAPSHMRIDYLLSRRLAVKCADISGNSRVDLPASLRYNRVSLE